MCMHAQEAALDRIVIRTLRPLNLVLGGFLLWTAATESGSYTGPYADAPMMADFFVGTALIASSIVAYAWHPGPKWANPYGFTTVVLLSFTSLVALAVRGSAQSTPTILLVVLGSGIVMLNLGWLAGALAVLAVGWIGVTRSLGMTDLTQPEFLLQIGFILSLVTAYGRRTAYLHLTTARDRARAAERQLREANAELDRFASVVTHDLQTPLSSLRLKARIARMAMEKHQDASAIEALADIDRIANDSGTFVVDMLDYARSGNHAAHMEPVTLDDVLAHVKTLVEAQLVATGATLEVGKLPTIQGDNTMLRQLFLNLISNSVRYRRDGVPLHIKVTAQSDAGGCSIAVEDNGEGFPQEAAERIFAPFERIKDAKAEGHGLGLATCKRVVESHGGTIRAEGRPGEGATFHVELPGVLLGPAADFAPTA